MGQRSWLTGTVLAVALAATGQVHADEPPVQATDAGIAADERLQRFLDTAAQQGRTARVSYAAADAVLAAVAIPPGAILVTREDPGLGIAGVMLLVDGGYGVLGLVSALAPGPMETLRDHHEQRIARGEGRDAVVFETEEEWKRMARRSRPLWRPILDFSLGGLELAAGMAFLLADPTLTLSRREQTVWGTLVVSVSLPAIGEGIADLIGSSNVANLWNLYETGKAASSRVFTLTSVTLAPVRAGMTGALHIAF